MNPDIIFIGRLAATALVISVAWRVTKATKRALDKRVADSFIYAGPWQNDPLGRAPQRLLAFMLMTVLAALFGAIWLWNWIAGFDLALGGLLALLVAFAAIIVIVLGAVAIYGFASAGMAMSRATRDGKLARTRGAARETNPHPRHTPIWRAWLRGWLGVRQ